MRRKTTEEFIENSKKIHGDKYNYNKVNYINRDTKVIITCPIHGEFCQKPKNHLNGQGCPQCAYDLKRLTTEEFIEKAKSVHGDKYDYSKVEYKNNETNVVITCPIHGDFEQSPTSHFSGSGCPACSGKKTYTEEEFIEKAKSVHGDKYDYSKVEYKKMYEKVIITCPKHGDFFTSM